MKKAFLAAMVMALYAPSANAAGLLGQTISFCTNSNYFGSVTSDATACSTSFVSLVGSATIADPGIEIAFDNNRFIDFTDTQIRVTYLPTGSPSPDLFVISGLTGITGFNIASDTLGITTSFANGTLGLLVSGNPGGPGNAVINVAPFASSVPEPAAWGMMILGVGAVGGIMRRRRYVTAKTVAATA